MLTCGTLALTALRPGLAVWLAIFSLSAAFGVTRSRPAQRLSSGFRRAGGDRPWASPMRAWLSAREQRSSWPVPMP
jgi:hypothetical protein